MKHTTYNSITANEAICKGFFDGGCQMAFNFPGFKSHLIFSSLGGKQISINEKVAYEEAFGSSLAGKRTVVSFKNVGLNVAADAYLNSLISGVNAGLVVVVTEDTDVSDSQNLMDSRYYMEFYGGLWLEPFDPQSAYDLAYHSFAWSEKFHLPVVIRLTSRLFDTTGKLTTKIKINYSGKPVYNHDQYIIHPTNWKKQQVELNRKNTKIRKFVESIYRQNTLKNINVIAFGACGSDIADANLSKSNLLQIYTYPFPESLIEKTIINNPEIKVFEVGGVYALSKINQYIGHGFREIKNNPSITPDLSSTYRVWNKLENLFRSIKYTNPDYVIADLTQFTRENTDTVDSCLCLGSSVAVGIGFAMSGYMNVVAVVGDASFIHGGTDILTEAVLRKVKILIVLVDNGGSWCTGNQKPIPFNRIKNIQGISYKKIDYTTTTADQLRGIVKKCRETPGVTLLHLLTK